MKSPIIIHGYDYNEVRHKEFSHHYNNNVKHKLLYNDKLKEVRHRIKLQHRIDRCIKIDVAITPIEKVFASFDIIKRLITQTIERSKYVK